MSNISRHSIVQTAEIGENVEIQEFVVIRERVRIGNNVIIHPHVIIEPGVIIGDNVEIFSGTYIGKAPKGAGATSREIIFRPFVRIGDSCAIGPNAVIYYDVSIGNNTLVGDGASIREQCKVGSFCLLGRYVTVNYNSTIGNHVKIIDLTHITGNCTIGNNVFISLCVGTSNDNAIGKSGCHEDQIHGPIIEDGAVIGLGASLLPNVRIGENAVVGAGAVVSKDVPSNTVVMGVPAKIVKRLELDPEA